MIIIENKIEYSVIAKISENDKVSYLTIDKKNHLYFFSNMEKGELYEEGKIVNNCITDDNTVAELNYVNKEVCYKIWFKDYSSLNEKQKYSKLKNNIILEYTNVLNKIIKKDLYKERIKNNKFETWKNNFKNEVYKIEEKKFYINDQEYDIFYRILDEDEFEFEFLDK